MTVAPPDDVPLEQMPLFMREMPADTTGNVALEMLQAILSEGTPDERAATLKTHGNEAYALGTPRHISDAVHFYTRALDQGCADAVLNATIHINRAAAHLALGNYAAAQRDAEAFLEVAPREGTSQSVVIKAHSRKARAALYTGDLEAASEAIAALVDILGVKDGGNVPPVLADLQRDYAAADEPFRAVRDVMSSLGAKRRRGQVSMPVVVKGAEDEMLSVFPDDGARSQLLEALGTVHIGKEDTLWPVVLFYPADSQTDVLGAVAAGAAVGDILAHVTSPPPAWDAAGRYSNSRALRVFFVSSVPAGVRRNRPFEGTRLVEVRHAATIADLVHSGHVVAVERGILGLHVLPDDEVSLFVHRFGSVHAVL